MNPKIYLVGGAVRDILLGRESKDHDYVVVGATPEWMIDHGYERVGSSFPVYLKDGCEYALARQERKVGPGYHGFETTHDSSVSLEDDLLRRDLTINSMAMSEDGQNVIDPYGGLKDLEDKVLRHTSEAFAEDPLRVLRLARFAARYEFTVHPSTIELAKKIVEAGELSHLPKERIWIELFKGLSEPNPAIMMKVLDSCGALNIEPLNSYFPDGIDYYPHIFNTFITFKENEIPLDTEVKFLLMMPGVCHLKLEESNNLRIPTSFWKMSVNQSLFDHYLAIDELITPKNVLSLIQSTRFDRDEDSHEMRCVIRALQVEDGLVSEKYRSRFLENLERLRIAVHAIRKIDLQSVVASGDKSTVKQRVEQAKLEAIKSALEGNT